LSQHLHESARHEAESHPLAPAERFVRLLALMALLYVFLIAVDLLGGGIKGLGENFTDSLFQGVGNPLAGLFVGILGTVLVQSSSVTTSTIVALVGSGVLTVPEAVPMVMGANIGTTITNTLASLGSISRPEEFRRAFAGATVHDFFNIFSVIILLPIEVATGFLSRTAVALSGLFVGARGGEFHSPIKGVVGAGADLVQSFAEAVAPAGRWSAALVLLIGLVLIFVSLVAITKTMKVVVAGAAERSLNAVLGRSGALGIAIGLVITVAVQSSSISTSLLIPMIAAGVLSLENAYPITLGANMGTTITALIAAMAVPQIQGLQIALVHTLFNVVGTLLFFPIAATRRLPIGAARFLADQAVRRRTVVMGYIVVTFVLVPLVGILLLR
jgi:sodium-dependent phosphate cotransporter